MATLEERLRLVVDATTGSAEASFGKLTGSARDTARASDDAAESVARAADVVAQARAREADAAGKLSVAEVKLAETRRRYGEGSSQVATAEERVASAQRRVQLASAETTQAVERQDAAQRKIADSAEQAGRGTDRYSERVANLRGQVAGLVAGVSIADWLRDSTSGYLNGARSAASLAQAMNATTEEGGRLVTLVGALGLEMDDLLEIQAEFAQQVAADADLLPSFGAAVQQNADGTTNWALTLQDALANLQKIPDATQRNALGFRIFGEEGYKQLSRLLLSGRSVEEALASIGTPFTDEDVEATRAYDAAMLELSSTGGALARTVGGTLVPVLTEVLGAFGEVVDIVEAVPGPLGIAIGLTIAYGLANRAAAESGGLLVATQAATSAGWARVTGAVAAATAGTGAFAATAGVARVAGAGLMATLGGPVGLAILGLGAGFSILNTFMGENEDRAEGVTKATETLTTALQESNGVVTDSVREQAALAAQQAGLLDVARRAGVSQGDVTAALLGNEAAYKRVQRALADYAETNRTENISDESGFSAQALNEEGEAARRAGLSLDELSGSVSEQSEQQAELAEELGATVDQTALAEAAMDALTAAIDAGQTTGRSFTEVVRGAAEAQDASAATTDRANAAIEAYNALTRDAVAATRERIDAVYASEDANFRFLDALDAANSATDDGTTSVNEQREAQVKLAQAALATADAAADAAVAGRQAAGEVLTDVDEANVRATAMIDDLRARLNTPGLAEGSRAELQGLIDQLTTAQENGDIEATLRLTGATEAAGEIDETAKDRDTTVTVESRGGPAVISYLDGIAAATRLAVIRVESRNGPAVDTYLDGLTRERLAIIRVETRGGPAVEAYLDRLARDRTVTIAATQSGGAGQGAGMRGAPNLAATGAGGTLTLNATVDLELVGRADRAELSRAERGRLRVEEIRAYEQRNGTGWRKK